MVLVLENCMVCTVFICKWSMFYRIVIDINTWYILFLIASMV